MVSLLLSLPYKGGRDVKPKNHFKVISPRYKRNIMEIVKRIARWIIRKELKSQDEALLEQSKLIRKLRGEQKESPKILLSQTIVECIVKMLPDPNQTALNKITSKSLISKITSFEEKINGRWYIHSISFAQVIASKDEDGTNYIQGLTVGISDYNIKIFIPLRRDEIIYETHGVQTSIYTNYWDFCAAGIRMISDEAFAASFSFVNAQRNVLKELKEKGLL